MPKGAGTGKATVTLSFPDWKEGHVAPVTFEVPVVAPEGFLTPEEVAVLDAVLQSEETPEASANEEAEWTQ